MARASSAALVAALVAMVMAVEFASIADAKYNGYLRVYEEPGCRGQSEKYEACGCHNLKYGGSYKYVYNKKHDGDKNMLLCMDHSCDGDTRWLSQAVLACARIFIELGLGPSHSYDVRPGPSPDPY
ncbi:hypothetical protein EJ110_NYTH59449 [Nymphaea thermarum]|nr:hypothetical protein EJ110_NYTH59449 [Nymphaea thermarum]